MTSPPKQPTVGGEPSLAELCRQLLPLSLSDAAMAVADPLMAITLTRLPDAKVALAALGVVKAVAVFLESPIIMVLHASTALGRWRPSRQALSRFVVGLASFLTLALLALSLPQPYRWLTHDVYSLGSELASAARWPLLIMFLWPALIAWRRIHQGHLILQGRGNAMGLASMARVGTFSVTLLFGYSLELPGATIGACALMVGLLVEGCLAYVWSRQAEVVEERPARPLPEDVPAVARYYAPLALTMLLMWGGRAALVAILSRAVDASLALAAWSASWGFVILVANLTRMVQQLVIKYALSVPASRLLALGGWTGLLCAVALAVLGYTPPGSALLGILIGHDPALAKAAQEVVEWSVLVPLLVALQNVLQGFCIVTARTVWVNAAGLAGVGVTLASAWWGVSNGWPGASVGAVSIAVGLLVEVLLLGVRRPWMDLHKGDEKS